MPLRGTSITFVPGLVSMLLLLPGLMHLFAGGLTERWMSEPAKVRTAGAVLLLLAGLCAPPPGWYFLTLGLSLDVSGLWRSASPASSIRAQRRSYPRWVHGCLLLVGACLVWAFRPA